MNCSECDLMWLYMYSACIMWGIREQQFLLLLLYIYFVSVYVAHLNENVPLFRFD